VGDAGAGLIHSRTSTGITDLAGDVVRHIDALTSDAQDLAIVAVALSRYHLNRQGRALLAGQSRSRRSG
jgi:hypothetical protein